MADKKLPHAMRYNDSIRDDLLRIAALFSVHKKHPDRDPECIAFESALRNFLDVAENIAIHGKAQAFIPPALAQAIEAHPAFFDRLADPELIEWLEPLVMARPRPPVA
jgi:hypothetical protein